MTALHLSIPREWPPLADLPCRHCSAPARDALGLCTECDEAFNLAVGVRFQSNGITWDTVHVVPVDVRAVPRQLGLFGEAS